MSDQQTSLRTTVVADVMTEEVISVTPVATATEVAELMRNLHVRDVFVVEDGRLQGVVTDRDLVVQVVADGLDPLTASAGRLRGDVPVVLSPGVPVEEAARIMGERAIRRSPVVDDQGHPVGTVTSGDLAQRSAMVAGPAAELAQLPACSGATSR